MRVLYLAAVSLHIIAAMIWIGGMVAVALAVMPQVRRLEEPHRSRFLWSFFGRFRALMWSAFVVVGLTGIVVLGVRGVSPGDLVDPGWRRTMFGGIVTLKIVLYVVGGSLAFVHERVRSAGHARALGRAALGVGLVTVLLAVMLLRGY